MQGRFPRSLIVLTAVAALGGMLAGGAYAMSDGGYSPQQQDCPPDAEANDAGDPGAQQPDAAVPGCHNMKLNVEDGDGNRFVQWGVDQIPNHSDGTPSAFGFTVDANGTPSDTPTGTCAASSSGVAGHIDVNDPSSATVTPCTATPGANASALVEGFTFYFGADDNLNFGEHDGASGKHGTSETQNGPSDGGAIVVDWHPGEADAWSQAVSSGDSAELLHNPVPVASAGTGMCADGICMSVQTRQTAVYHGGRNGESRNVYDYSGKDWDPFTCNSADQDSERPESCGGKSLNNWKNHEAENVYAQPGVQVYEDPDASASPLDPIYESGMTDEPVLYPLPAVYAGTCGVTVGGGPLLPDQVSVPTGC